MGYSSLFVLANSLWRLVQVFRYREALLSVMDGRSDVLDDAMLDSNEGIVASV